MPNQPFFFVNDEPISQQQIIDYLKFAGQFEEFTREILSQHAIAQAFQTYPDLLPNEEAAGRLLQEFCQTQDLNDSAVLDSWLQQNNLTLPALSNTLQRQWGMQQLIQQVSQPRLHECFIRRKLQLDQVYLSYIIVQEETLASELYEQIKEGNAFEQLAQRYSLDDTGKSGGRLPPIAREALSDDLRAALEVTQSGELVGPLAVDDRWCLFRLEKILPAALEGDIQTQLQDELFQQWLDEQVAAMTVKMEVRQWLYL